MRYHWLKLRATAHATEDPDRVAEAMRTVSGVADGFEELCQADALESQHGSSAVLLEATLSRARQIRDCLNHILGDKPGLLAEVDRRTDDDGVFYLRFDKQAAFEGNLVPTTGEDAVQVRLRMEVHPAHRDNTLAALRELLQAEKA